jgi:hypothetical protein
MSIDLILDNEIDIKGKKLYNLPGIDCYKSFDFICKWKETAEMN